MTNFHFDNNFIILLPIVIASMVVELTALNDLRFLFFLLKAMCILVWVTDISI